MHEVMTMVKPFARTRIMGRYDVVLKIKILIIKYL